MRECDNSKIHTSSNFLLSVCLIIMLDTLLLVPSLHCNTSLHFTTLHQTTLHYTYRHFTSFQKLKIKMKIVFVLRHPPTTFPLQSVLTQAVYRQATRNSHREWQYHMLHVYNCILMKMSTWCSKHVEENSILWINNNQCIKVGN